MTTEATENGQSTAVTLVASGSRSVVPPGTSAATAKAMLAARPARKQVTHREVENMRQANDKSNQTGLTYNIWWNQWSGGDYEDDRKGNLSKAAKRVNVARDAGFTRGDKQDSAYICLFFARGMCPNGADCTFLHTLPFDTPSDQGHDVFGREKHGDYRDDMGGVGTIQRVNRTLYVGRIVEEPDMGARISNGGGTNRSSGSGRTGSKDIKWNAQGNTVAANSNSGGKGWDRSMNVKTMSGTERVLYRHFSEFGELDRVRVLHSRGCGFVTFVREVDAQFAKEAMMRQSLDHDECINLRWATDDPNLGAQKRDRNQREREGLQAIEANLSEEARAAGQSLLQLESADGHEGDAKRARPNTTGEEMSEEEYQRLVEENERNWAEMERRDAKQDGPVDALGENDVTPVDLQSAAAMANGDLPQTETVTTSLISSNALEALQARRTKQSIVDAKTSASPAALRSALGGLADYGSDSD